MRLVTAGGFPTAIPFYPLGAFFAVMRLFVVSRFIHDFPVFLSFPPSPHVPLDCRPFVVFVGLAAPPLPSPPPLVGLGPAGGQPPPTPPAGCSGRIFPPVAG